jgi:iron-sulfur cluster repair protein YtfE (RIC family)
MAGGVDAIEFLQVQHRSTEKLFAAYWAAPVGADRRPLLLELADLLTAHAAVEERHLYPALRTKETAAALDDAYDDHREVKETILHLLDIGPLDETFPAELEQLQARVQAHVATEERELFPFARAVLGPQRLAAMGRDMVATTAALQEEGQVHDLLAADLT